MKMTFLRMPFLGSLLLIAMFNFQSTQSFQGPTDIGLSRTSIQKPPRRTVLDFAKNSGNKTKTSYEYKDDCFGFMTFVGGVASRDAAYTGVFVGLSLVAAAATRQGILPPDPKRSTIVDRKVPGTVAALTLVLSPMIDTDLLSRILDTSIPTPAQDAPLIQLAIGGFSIVTAFLDIRWRDRFDYPDEFM